MSAVGCRLFTSLRSGIEVDNESQIITHTGRAEWRRSRTQGRGYNHGNGEQSIGRWEAPSAPVIEHQEGTRVVAEKRSLSSAGSSDLGHSDYEVICGRAKRWRVVVAMK